MKFILASWFGTAFKRDVLMVVGMDVCQVWGEGGGQTNVSMRGGGGVNKSLWL